MIYQVVVPVLLLFVPWLVVRYVLASHASRRMSYRQSAPYLVPAAALWAAVCALPEIPLFGGATETFFLHLSGGVIAAVLFWYAVRAYGIKFKLWWQEPVFLYAFVSAAGVLNELFEFFLYQAGWIADNGADTWWDLAANTLAAALAFLAVRLARLFRTSG